MTKTADRKLTEAEMAESVGIKKQTAALWRMLGKGPKFYKIGRRVVYPESEIEKFLSSRLMSNTSEAASL